MRCDQSARRQEHDFCHEKWNNCSHWVPVVYILLNRQYTSVLIKCIILNINIWIFCPQKVSISCGFPNVKLVHIISGWGDLVICRPSYIMSVYLYKLANHVISVTNMSDSNHHMMFSGELSWVLLFWNDQHHCYYCTLWVH